MQDSQNGSHTDTFTEDKQQEYVPISTSFQDQPSSVRHYALSKLNTIYILRRYRAVWQRGAAF